MNKTLHSQRGISLVGLMVASLIGLFIIGAALQMYNNSQQTFKARQAIAAASENGRFALSDLRRMIVMAGRGMDASSARDKQAIDKTFTSMATSILNTSEGGTNASDSLEFRVAKGRDCLGNTITEVPIAGGKTRGTVTVISYSVQVNADGISELVCSVDGGTPQPLVSGIEMLKFLYGIDTTDDNYANQYLTAADINTLKAVPGNEKIWEEIISIRIGVLSTSAEFTLPSGRRATTTPLPKEVLHGQYQPVASIGNKNDANAWAYRVNTETVALRNLIVQ
jgi:type IV pilus assembly protein PilW